MYLHRPHCPANGTIFIPGPSGPFWKEELAAQGVGLPSREEQHPCWPGEMGKKDKNGERQLGRGNGWGPVLSFARAGAQAFPMCPVKVTGEECQWVLRTEKVLGKV